MAVTVFQVDAFATPPFRGNPAGVCILAEPRRDEWLQSVAKKMNLSETAFLLRQEEGYQLRWFTPTVEVDLCGHATLASAHVLWEESQLPPNREARFHTRSGLLTARRNGDWIEMDFPAEAAEPCNPPEGLLAAFDAIPQFVGQNRFDYLLEFDSEETVRRLSPNFELLMQLGVRGVIVTAKAASRDFDFVSRFFAPDAGVLEDPVTGSAHCCLGPYWQPRLKKDQMLAYQASERGGIVRVQVKADRVVLGGQAVTGSKSLLE